MNSKLSADWTLNPVTERTVALDRRRQTWARQAGCVSLLALVGFGSLLPLLVEVAEGVSARRFALVALLLGAVVYAASRRAAQHTEGLRSRRAALREEFSEVGGWPMEVTILQGAAPTGHDAGVVWFEDDRLMFAGERTSFALVSAQAENTVGDVEAVEGARFAISLPLRVKTAAGPVSLAFEPVPDDRLRSEDGIDPRFRGAIHGWAMRMTDGESQLPPLTLGPDAPTSESMFLRALGATLVWPFTLLLLTALAFWMRIWVLPVAVGALAFLLQWSAAWSPLALWRAYRDRRRLDGLEWKT